MTRCSDLTSNLTLKDETIRPRHRVIKSRDGTEKSLLIGLPYLQKASRVLNSQAIK